VRLGGTLTVPSPYVLTTFASSSADSGIVEFSVQDGRQIDEYDDYLLSAFFLRPPFLPFFVVGSVDFFRLRA
jgi:hypothetical protein